MKRIKILEVRAETLEKLNFHNASKETGKRFVFSDNKNNPNGQIYTILREFGEIKKDPEFFVAQHAHKSDSLLIFFGKGNNLTGFYAEIIAGNRKYLIKSPKSVYIPAGVPHAYRPLKGKGYFMNILIAKNGNYNKSLKRM